MTGKPDPRRLRTRHCTTGAVVKIDAASGEHLLTVKEAAERTRVSVRHLRRMIKEGQLPVIRLGKVVRIHPKHLGLEPS